MSAAAAIVVERGSGVVLGAKNPDLRWAPASTTKMMTGLLAVEAIAAGDVSLSDTVTIQSNVGDENGGEAGLAPGDTISFRDLLYMMLVPSMNDAAVAVGTYVGSQPNGLGPATARTLFVNRMNERADELGLTNTSFVDISGRDPEDLGDEGFFPAQAGCDDNEFDNPLCAHYSTARDLAELAGVALDDPLFAAIVKTTTGARPRGAAAPARCGTPRTPRATSSFPAGRRPTTAPTASRRERRIWRARTSCPPPSARSALWPLPTPTSARTPPRAPQPRASGRRTGART